MNADGSAEVQLTFKTQPELAPAISPKGNRLAFTRRSKDGTRFSIWTIRADGSGPVKRTFGVFDFAPDWQPLSATYPAPDRVRTYLRLLRSATVPPHVGHLRTPEIFDRPRCRLRDDGWSRAFRPLSAANQVPVGGPRGPREAGPPRPDVRGR